MTTTKPRVDLSKRRRGLNIDPEDAQRAMLGDLSMLGRYVSEPEKRTLIRNWLEGLSAEECLRIMTMYWVTRAKLPPRYPEEWQEPYAAWLEFRHSYEDDMAGDRIIGGEQDSGLDISQYVTNEDIKKLFPGA